MPSDAIQRIIDADEDAISFSGFVNEPSDEIIQRRLAPPMKTLNYYRDYLHGLELVYSQQSGVVDVNGVQVKPVKVALDDALDAAVIGGGGLADTAVATVPKMTGEVARTQSSKNKDTVSVKDFGAKGDGNQTLIDIAPYKVGSSQIYTISKQTADGLAFCNALNYLKSIGGGSLYVPKGVYRVYGTLPIIDFQCKIYGDGGASKIINCDTSPSAHGYGLFTVIGASPIDVMFSDLLLDGNGENRTKPNGEYQAYNLAVYGAPRFRANNITSLNCLIDCFYVDMSKQPEHSEYSMLCHVSASVFDNSFRNTISCISGINIVFEGCTVTRGGFLHGGTNPKYCVDIEPNSRFKAVKTKWSNCVFASARNVIFGGIWTESQLVNCSIEAGEIYPGETRPDYPWLTSISAGQWDFDNCKFKGRKDTSKNYFRQMNNYDDDYIYANSAYLNLRGCSFSNAGLISESRTISLIDCIAQNSLTPFFFGSGNQSIREDVFIRNLRLVNIFDVGNLSTGFYSSFVIHHDKRGILDVDGLTVEVDTGLLTDWGVSAAVFGTLPYRGVTFPTRTNSKDRAIVKNVHSEGFYRRLPTFLGVSPNDNNYRDWNLPAAAPADTDKLITTVAAGGGTATTVVSRPSIGSLTTVDGRSIYYKDCTMWGNYE